MNRYAFSYLVSHQQGYQKHGAGFLQAASDDEANGKALRIVRATYPLLDGWRQHHAICLIDTTPNVEPETAALLGEGRSS